MGVGEECGLAARGKWLDRCAASLIAAIEPVADADVRGDTSSRDQVLPGRIRAYEAHPSGGSAWQAVSCKSAHACGQRHMHSTQAVVGCE